MTPLERRPQPTSLSSMSSKPAPHQPVLKTSQMFYVRCPNFGTANFNERKAAFAALAVIHRVMNKAIK